MLNQFGIDIWTAEGPTVTAAAGFHYPTRMAVLRLGNGDLVVWSPVALTESLRTSVEALGPVRYLVPPNALHDSFLSAWQEAWPDAALLAPPGLAANRPDLVVSGELGSTPVAGWDGDIESEAVLGNRIVTEVVLFHRPSGTVLIADLLQQFPPGWFRGWRALIARLDLMVSPRPTVPRKFRFAFTDRAAARASLRRILAWPSEKLLIAHGTPVTSGAQAFLAEAFRWLRPG